MNKNKQQHKLTLCQRIKLSPHLQRLVFQSATPFSEQVTGQYLKLLFTPQGSTDLSELSSAQRPIMRTYTIQQLEEANQQLTIDMVTPHTQALAPTPERGGYGQYFAQQARLGDTIYMLGPNATKAARLGREPWLLVGDLSSLAALTTHVTTLPTNAKGQLFLEVNNEADIPHFKLPKGINATFIIKDQNLSLAATVCQHLTLEVAPYVWCACEFDDMRAIRRYLSEAKALKREQVYFSSYWKKGITEDGHKIAKQADQNIFSLA